MKIVLWGKGLLQPLDQTEAALSAGENWQSYSEGKLLQIMSDWS